MWNRGCFGVDVPYRWGCTVDIYAVGFTCLGVGIIMGLVLGGLCDRMDARAARFPKSSDPAVTGTERKIIPPRGGSGTAPPMTVLPPGRPSTYVPPIYTVTPAACRCCHCRGLSMEDL